MNSSDHIGRPDRRHTDHNRCFSHRDSDHGGRPIFVGNRHPDATYFAIVVARYLGPGRIVARPNESMYSWARSGEPGPSLCG